VTETLYIAVGGVSYLSVGFAAFLFGWRLRGRVSDRIDEERMNTWEAAQKSMRPGKN
jgi:hypothetical protein